MSEDHLTQEEREAMTAMEADTAPVTDEEQGQSSEPTADDAPPAEPEFKSSRAKPIDWNALTPEQQDAVSKYVNEGKPPPGFVTHQSMHSEREQRKELERRLAALEAQQQAKPEDAPPEWKDPIEDPEGNRKWSEWLANKSREDAIAEFQERQERAQAQAQRLHRAAEAEDAFTKQVEDYPQATEFLKNAREQQLRSQGYDEGQIMHQLRNDANSIFDAAMAVGMNPAQLIYMKAQELGYSAPQKDAERIEHLANAQRQTRGAGNAGGTAQRGDLTLAQLADMSESELAKLDPAVKRKAMGG